MNPSVHTQITDSQSGAHHITRGEQKEPFSKHQMQRDEEQQPSRQKCITQEEGERQRKDRNRGMQREMPVHMKRHREGERSIRMCSSTNKKMQHTFNTSNRWPTTRLTESSDGETMTGANRERRGREDGGMHVSFLKNKNKKNKRKVLKTNRTMAVKHCQAFQISVTHQKHLEAHRHTPSRTKTHQQSEVKGHLFTEIRTRRSLFL